MLDSFGQIGDSPEFSARNLFAITPGAADLDRVTKAVYIGTGGNIELQAIGDTASVIMKVSDGQIIPVRARKVIATGTTATGIVGMA